MREKIDSSEPQQALVYVLTEAAIAPPLQGICDLVINKTINLITN